MQSNDDGTGTVAGAALIGTGNVRIDRWPDADEVESATMSSATAATDTQTKFQATRDALRTAVGELPGNLGVGLTLRPNMDNDGATAADVDHKPCVDTNNNLAPAPFDDVRSAALGLPAQRAAARRYNTAGSSRLETIAAGSGARYPGSFSRGRVHLRTLTRHTQENARCSSAAGGRL
jgi:hypothetical protein